MIKVSEPILSLGNETNYVREAIDKGEVSSSGSFVRRFEEAFAKWSGNDYAVAVSSGTAALEVSIWALGIKEISIPTGTIISCYTAAIRAGATVTLRDNRSEPFPPGFLKNAMRCHLFGSFDPSPAEKIVDDLSQYWKPYRVQNVGCYSLYANKLITCGEGGIIVTNDKEVYERCRSYRDLCHSSERFVHTDMGYNFRMSNLQAALALAQLEQIDLFTKIKQTNRDLYLHNLPSCVEPLFDVEVPWMYLVRTEMKASDAVFQMKEAEVECRRFFFPLHSQSFINIKGDFAFADNLWRKTFYLPSGLTLTEREIISVSTKLLQVLRPL